MNSLYHPELEFTLTDSPFHDRENASGQDALFVRACVGVCLKAGENKNCVCVCACMCVCVCG